MCTLQARLTRGSIAFVELCRVSHHRVLLRSQVAPGVSAVAHGKQPRLLNPPWTNGCALYPLMTLLVGTADRDCEHIDFHILRVRRAAASLDAMGRT